MTHKGNTFPKSERLCSRKAIEALFAGGNRALSAFPLRVVYRVIDSTTQPVPRTQVLISVSKRHFKHAVDRNRAKRQIREAWRLNRDILNPHPSSLNPPLDLCRSTLGEPSTLNPPPPTTVPEASASVPPLSLHLAFIWLSDEPQSSDLVQRKMKNLLHRIKEEQQLFTEQRTNGFTD